VQQGFNELLNILFKQKEDEAMEALSTRMVRLQCAEDLDRYQQWLMQVEEEKYDALKAADRLRTEEMLRGIATSNGHPDVQDEDGRPLPEASTVSTADMPMQSTPDPSDHIELMFGADPEASGPQLNSSSDLNDTEAESPSSWHDPTLPQFRPDESTATCEKGTGPTPFKHRSEVYDKWLQHRQVDYEAQQRGGYGRLSLREFKRKMVLEDEVGKALGGAEKTDDADIEWESSADLGKLAFVGTWLEMASF